MKEYIVLLFVFTVLITFLYIKHIQNLLIKSKCLRENYCGKKIPSIGGIIFIPILLSVIIIAIAFRALYFEQYMIFMFSVLSVGFIALLDDLIGEKDIKGIRNHFVNFLKGNITTGFLKASITSLVSIIVCIKVSNNIYEMFINFFIIVFFTNTLNLLDLRPGRTIKFFLLSSIVLLIRYSIDIDLLIPLFIMTVTAAIFLHYDLKEMLMLGDVGSNILGITLGYYCVILQSIIPKVFILSFLLFLNILSEKLSLTKIINSNKLLSYIDKIGRRKT